MYEYIIVADDDADDRALMQEVLSEVAFPLTAYFVQDGWEIITHLEQCDNLLPKFIILDLNMPKINGMEVLKYMRSNNRFASIPVYIMTTSASEKNKLNCLSTGAKAFFTKPDSYNKMLHWAETIKALAIAA